MRKTTGGTPATAPVPRRSTTERLEALDDRWDQQMTRLLREAAGVREQRERARADEDDRSSRREAAALLELVRAHDRPKAVSTTHVQPIDGRRDRRS